MKTYLGLPDLKNDPECDRGESLAREIRERLEEVGASDEWLRAWAHWRDEIMGDE